MTYIKSNLDLHVLLAGCHFKSFYEQQIDTFTKHSNTNRLGQNLRCLVMIFTDFDV